jgi:2,3-dihydroxybenzoate decarboxylase
MRKIAVEEHFTTEEHLDHLNAIIEKKYPVTEVIQEEKILSYEVPFLVPSRREEAVNRLLDIGEARVNQMDKDGIDVQVLSLVSPGIQVFDAPTGTALAKKINNRLSEAVSQYPERLAGFASLAPQNPGEAADELERAVIDLGLKGACINSHTKGEYLDEKKYWVIFERAEKMGVPIYIHPRSPSPEMIKPYLDYPMLTTAMIGFAAEVSLHALRLISSGLFDAFPRLNIILGHLGEALPYWLWRLDNIYLRAPAPEKLSKAPSEYFKDNFFVTTSGMFWQPPLLCSYLALGAEKILFAVDYPMESNEVAVKFMEEVTICDSDKEKIYHRNAEQLFGL